MTNHWLESRWNIKKSEAESFQAKLEHLGSLGFFEQLDLDPLKEAHRTTTEMVVYFPDHPSLNEFAKRLKPLESETTELLVIKRIPEGNWATEWKKYFKPLHLTKQIVIRPSWEPYTPKDNEKVVTLDPGMAFGTGQHDTTKFCAEYICELKAKNPHWDSLLDIGCGSGILSIIARKVGFNEVTGIDNDAPAIDTSHENLDLNPDATPIQFFQTQGSLNHAKLKAADVVAANIIAETLCELSQDLMRLTKQEGCLILSGILPERGELVKQSFKDMKLINQKQSKDWHAYVYTHK